MIGLSVVIIAHNEENNILRCLGSVKAIADEIVLIDSFSTDDTFRISKEFGCKVIKREFDGYGSQKQFAVDQASNDWVLSVDADEVVSPGLSEEILRWKKEGERPSAGNTTSGGNITHPADSQKTTDLNAGYLIPFSLFYMGRILKHGGVGHEYHLRLFDRTRGGFTRVPVHEGIEVSGRTGTLQGKIIHYSYRDISHHLAKINTYTTQAASGYVSRGRSFSKGWVFLKFPGSFISVYLIKGGWRDGYPGFVWAFMAAFYASVKVAKTIEQSNPS